MLLYGLEAREGLVSPPAFFVDRVDVRRKEDGIWL
jgi:hypothetical protein